MRICFSALLVLTFLSGFSQTTPPPDLAPGYYVVVASYIRGEESFALSYSAKLNQEGKHSAVGYDPGRKFFHVYLDEYTEFNESIQQMLKARSAGFGTAWVRIMKGMAAPEKPATQVVAAPENKTPSVAQNTAPVVEKPAVKKELPAVAESKPTEAIPPTVEQLASTPANPASVKEVVPEITNNEAFMHPKLLTDGAVLFVMFNPTNRESVDGTVEIVDSEKSKLITKAKGNDSLMLPDPKTKSGKLTLIGSSFGYRPVQHEVNYMATEKDSVPNFMDVVNNRYRISFGMDKLRRGDITVLYNVYFYNDAAVMLPDSKYELNKLLQLMNDNPGYRIKLHGHTNGNGQGKIVSMGKAKDFFTLTSDDKQGFGSAKELSRQRAQVIKDWLVDNKVASDRIEVQAHGGSRMIHDKNGANAKRNVRVEVEML